MTLGFFAVLHMLGAPFLLGAAVLALFGIRRRDDALAHPAWAMLTGSLAIGVLWLPWLALELPLRAFLFIPLPLALLLFAIARARRRPPARDSRDAAAKSYSRLERVAFVIALAFVLIVTADRVLRATERPILLGDEMHIWSGRGMALFAAGGFNERFHELLTPAYHLEHTDYPLLNPLLHLWAFDHAGKILLVENRLPFHAFVAALMLLVAAVARRVSRPGLAAAAVVLISACPAAAEEARNAAADTMVALGLLTALDAFQRFRAGGSRRWLALFAIACAFLAWSKNEGMMLAACTGAAAFVVGTGANDGTPRWRVLLALIPAAAVVAFQAAFNSAYGLKNDILSMRKEPPLVTRIVDQAGEHVPVIGRYVLDYVVLRPEVTQWLHLAFAVLLVAAPLMLFRRMPFATTVLLLGMLGFFLVYVGTPRDIDWHLRWSIERILFQLAPSVAVWIAAALVALAGRVRQGGSTT